MFVVCLLEGPGPHAMTTPAHGGIAVTSPVEERGVVALDQALRDLTNPFTIISVAARPGDEDAGVLAYYRKKLGARTVSVFATRAGAGDLDHQDAAESSRKALESARVLGADAYFLNLRDIGASKSPDEALSTWGREEALSRMVRAIRSLRPDVIVVNGSQDADGRHQAVVKLALDAFFIAGDGQRFPDLTPSWQSRRMYERTEEKTADVSMNLDEYDYIRGKTYRRIAEEAVARYGLPERIPDSEPDRYKLIASGMEEKQGPAASFIDGLVLPTNLARSVEPPRLVDSSLGDALLRRDKLVAVLSDKLLEKRAEGSKEQLQARYGNEFFRVVRFTETLERGIALALGIEFEMRSSDRVLTRGQKFSLKLTVRNGAPRLIAVAFHLPDQFSGTALKPTRPLTVSPTSSVSQEFEYEIPSDAPYTLPHANHSDDAQYYAIASVPAGSPVTAVGRRLVAFAEIEIAEATILVPAFVVVDVAPPVEMSLTPNFAFVRDWEQPRELRVTVKLINRTQGALTGALWVVPLALTDDEYEPVLVKFSTEDESATVVLKLELPVLKPPLSPDVLIEFRKARPAAAEALDSAKLFVKTLDFEISPGLNVAYVRGQDDSLPIAFEQLGIESRELTISEIRAAGLARFDTIVIDRLAYELHPGLASCGEVLLDYVNSGGNLIVLYQRPGDWLQGAPFSLSTSLERISVAAPPVRLVHPDHALLGAPNKIGAKDFDGWEGERALFPAREWGDQYAALLECGDPAQKTARGGLLVAEPGKGTYVYAAYTLPRQLRAMNAGAYRLLANFVSLPRVMKAQPQRTDAK